MSPLVRSDKLNELLGINRRNLELLYTHNQRRFVRSVDDKVRAKEILESHGIAVPETICTAGSQLEISRCIDAVAERDSFVIKPSLSYGGQGVMVVERTEDGSWQTPGGHTVKTEDIRFHMASIISGMYAMDHVSDCALVEAKVEEAHEFRAVHGAKGVSDIRVIVLEGTPLMAMLRMPCAASNGRANLHAGGIGVGIDLASGVTLAGIENGRVCESHPDTGVGLRGHVVPFWQEVVSLAKRLNDAFQLGYLGGDFVIDEQRGPLVLEVNARPGLEIQLANETGLLAVMACAGHDRGEER